MAVWFTTDTSIFCDEARLTDVLTCFLTTGLTLVCMPTINSGDRMIFGKYIFLLGGVSRTSLISFVRSIAASIPAVDETITPLVDPC